MLLALTISREDIFHQLQISCQIPSVVEGIVTRKIIADAAAGAGIQVEPAELQQAADKLRLMSQLRTIWQPKFPKFCLFSSLDRLPQP
ncbi:hypothetical protein [Kamptonema formosum]|uniref:hypothetical protein n=1 Tax=Kamptonema formosum TaxID=331992 RepID=UPI00034D3B0D|nr:hypothetical protein [Oscillatoria sp. PCC 10802]